MMRKVVAPIQLAQPTGAHWGGVAEVVGVGVHEHHQRLDLGGGGFEQQLVAPVRRPEFADHEAGARGRGVGGG
jgi:hypothetical protein